eukprot:TRINITY_DN8575_c0_g1_i15.p1 TRINITY_DN8575_c0_g1~~TRINITY_DN8575_c0_g1_i15.p1  ORF type:complete len:697 (+),score=107.87 TRINITY_DN8575_c0_g1_i15:446-2536(+)
MTTTSISTSSSSVSTSATDTITTETTSSTSVTMTATSISTSSSSVTQTSTSGTSTETSTSGTSTQTSQTWSTTSETATSTSATGKSTTETTSSTPLTMAATSHAANTISDTATSFATSDASTTETTVTAVTLTKTQTRNNSSITKASSAVTTTSLTSVTVTSETSTFTATAQAATFTTKSHFSLSGSQSNAVSTTTTSVSSVANIAVDTLQTSTVTVTPTSSPSTTSSMLGAAAIRTSTAAAIDTEGLLNSSLTQSPTELNQQKIGSASLQQSSSQTLLELDDVRNNSLSTAEVEAHLMSSWAEPPVLTSQEGRTAEGVEVTAASAVGLAAGVSLVGGLLLAGYSLRRCLHVEKTVPTPTTRIDVCQASCAPAAALESPAGVKAVQALQAHASLRLEELDEKKVSLPQLPAALAKRQTNPSELILEDIDENDTSLPHQPCSVRHTALSESPLSRESITPSTTLRGLRSLLARTPKTRQEAGLWLRGIGNSSPQTKAELPTPAQDPQAQLLCVPSRQELRRRTPTHSQNLRCLGQQGDSDKPLAPAAKGPECQSTASGWVRMTVKPRAPNSNTLPSWSPSWASKRLVKEDSCSEIQESDPGMLPGGAEDTAQVLHAELQLSKELRAPEDMPTKVSEPLPQQACLREGLFEAWTEQNSEEHSFTKEPEISALAEADASMHLTTRRDHNLRDCNIHLRY